ncbi:MAG TPA: 2-dehydropantoate 2-reductase N-terminal domain-containing protein [Anaerolineales bacterium]|nr:2-dehydropantoate 2-reductase N-terminal domain-containing protein [Anaerolineales bacterium]HNH78135.1 2-dehydropantoate 2-reductase N-terminal domain-containing protein [Anaerolineales bacterium]
MKVLVVGAGIIGTIFGWALAEDGHDVTHFVRKGKAGNFPHGAQIDMLENRKGKKNFVGRYDIKLAEVLSPSDGFEVVIVPTKPYQLMDVLKEIVPQTGNADYLLLTQNWTGTAEIDAVLPQARYIFGDAHAGGVWKDGVLIATIMDDIILGQVDRGRGAVLQKFADLFTGINLKVTIPENILHYIWVQHAMTTGLWMGLVRTGSLENILKDPVNGPLSLQAVKECLTVAEKRGIDLQKYPEIKMYLQTGSKIGMAITGFVVRMMFKLNKSIQRSSAHGLGDPIEIRSAYEDLLKSGAEFGVPMPIMQSFRPDVERLVAIGVH